MKSVQRYWLLWAKHIRYFECNRDGKKIGLRRRVNTISQTLNRFGKAILLSATEKSWEEVLSLYRERDEVEKKFDDLKNELDVIPMRVNKIELCRACFSSSSYRLASGQCCFREPGRLDCWTNNPSKKSSRSSRNFEPWRWVENGGWQRFQKTENDIRKYGIGVPVEANLVIKKSGV